MNPAVATSERPAAAPRPGRWKVHLRRVLTPIVGIAIAIGVWQAVITVFDVQPYVMPAPGVVAKTLVQELPELLDNLWPTAYESIFGFLVGSLVAIALAIGSSTAAPSSRPPSRSPCSFRPCRWWRSPRS